MNIDVLRSLPIASIPQWVVWQSVGRENKPKPDKVPFSAITGQAASVSDSRTWATFDQGVQAYNTKRYAGMGFVLTKDLNLVGIDLDYSIADGKAFPWAQEIIARCASYSEISQSAKGLHILAYGQLPRRRKQAGIPISPGSQIEMYDNGRYLVMTGDVWPGAPTFIESRQEQIEALHAQYMGVSPKAAQYAGSPDDVTGDPLLVATALERLAPWRCHTYAPWIEVGMALHGLGDIGYQLWDSWSQKSDKYDADTCFTKWQTFTEDNSNGNRITMASLYHWANEDDPDAMGATTPPVVDEEVEPMTAGDTNTGYTPEKPVHDEDDLPVLSLHDLMTHEWPEPPWIVPGILPVGLAVLAGRPKVGKSWIALQLAQAVATGGRFLGEPVKRGPVLYLALEDVPRRLKRRAAMQGWTDFDSLCDFMGADNFRKIGVLNKGGGTRIAKAIRKRGYRLVVVDTLSRAISGDQDSVVEMTAALGPLQGMAQKHNCCVLILDHHNKMALRDMTDGTPFDVIANVLGSISKAGVADWIGGMYRSQGKEGTLLAFTGRDVEERQFTLKQDNITKCWQILSEEGKPKVTEGREQIIEILRTLGRTTCTDIANGLGRNRGNVYKQLCDLVSAGILEHAKEYYWIGEDDE